MVILSPPGTSQQYVGRLGPGAISIRMGADFGARAKNRISLIVWGGWFVAFRRMAQNRSAPDVLTKVCRALLKGSIAELLIAVPTHIFARNKAYCCAGVMTFIGITFGLSVMLFSFGPAIYYLYKDKWDRLTKRAGSSSRAH